MGIYTRLRTIKTTYAASYQALISLGYGRQECRPLQVII
jgi:hypothetical protein